MLELSSSENQLACSALALSFLALTQPLTPISALQHCSSSLHPPPCSSSLGKICPAPLSCRSLSISVKIDFATTAMAVKLMPCTQRSQRSEAPAAFVKTPGPVIIWEGNWTTSDRTGLCCVPLLGDHQETRHLCFPDHTTITWWASTLEFCLGG